MIVLFVSHSMIEIGRFANHSLEIIAVEKEITLSGNQIAQWVQQNCDENEISILFGGNYAYCCTIRNEPNMRNNPQAAGYAAEEHVPVAAEKMEVRIANPSSGKKNATAIASAEGLVDVVDGIRQHYAITFVGYAPLLALQAFSKQSRISKSTKDYHLLFESPDEVDLLTIVDRSLADWQWLPKTNESKSLFENPDWLIVRAGLTLPIVGFGETNSSSEASWDTPEIQYAGSYCKVRTYACETLQKIIAGKQQSIVDLPAIPGIGERNLDSVKTWFFAGVSMLLLGLALFFVVRTHQAEGKIEQLSSEIDLIYRDAYPDGPDTPLKQRTLNTHLAVLQEAKDLGQFLRPNVPFAEYLKTVLISFPENTEAEIRSFEMQSGSLTVRGFVSVADKAILDRRFKQAGFVVTINNRKQRADGRREFEYLLTPKGEARK